jgi:hypothetical protein
MPPLQCKLLKLADSFESPPTTEWAGLDRWPKHTHPPTSECIPAVAADDFESGEEIVEWTA